MLVDQTAQKRKKQSLHSIWFIKDKNVRSKEGKCIFTVDMMLAMAEPRYAQKKAAEKSEGVEKCKDELLFLLHEIQQASGD